MHFSPFPLAALLTKDRKGNGWVKNWNDIAGPDFYKKARLPPEALKTVCPVESNLCRITVFLMLREGHHLHEEVVCVSCFGLWFSPQIKACRGERDSGQRGTPSQSAVPFPRAARWRRSRPPGKVKPPSVFATCLVGERSLLLQCPLLTLIPILLLLSHHHCRDSQCNIGPVPAPHPVTCFFHREPH